MASIMENFSNYPIDLGSLPNYEDVNFYPISSKYLTKVNLQTGAFMVFLIIGWTVLFFYDVEPIALTIAGIVIPLFFLFKFWNNFKMQQSFGYALREKDILYRRGYFFRTVTVVPFNRIQHASISRDVLDKFLNISSLRIFTAGGSGSDIHIPGLQPDLALQLKEALAGKISANEY